MLPLYGLHLGHLGLVHSIGPPNSAASVDQKHSMGRLAVFLLLAKSETQARTVSKPIFVATAKRALCAAESAPLSPCCWPLDYRSCRSFFFCALVFFRGSRVVCSCLSSRPRLEPGAGWRLLSWNCVFNEFIVAVIAVTLLFVRSRA